MVALPTNRTRESSSSAGPTFVMDRDDPDAERRIEAVRSDLFERVMALDGSISGEHGTGLGLAIVQEIVRRHGGSVRAANRDPHGASIRISLPAVDSANGLATVQAPERPTRT